MRVAFVADDLYPGFGGQATASEGHIEALLALGHEVRVLAGAERSPETPPPGVVVDRLPVWRPGDKQTQLALPLRKKGESLLRWADVVQVNTPTPLALWTLWRARRWGVPSAMGFHTQEESLTLHFDRLRSLISPTLRSWYRFLYHRPDCLVAPTAFAARLVRGYTPRPVHVVSNGIRLPQHDPDRQKRVEALRGRLLDEKQFLLVYVSRLSHEKRPRDLLEIMSYLALLRRDARLIVAGRGPLQKELEQSTKKLGLADTVRFLGYVSEENKQDLLAAGDLFLMPSPTELQSIATLEAMARGCAVAALRSETSAVCEMIRESDCGLCYEVGRIDEAARGISRLLERPAELARVKENAIRAARVHDIHESGRRLEEIYTSLLRDR